MYVIKNQNDQYWSVLEGWRTSQKEATRFESIDDAILEFVDISEGHTPRVVKLT